MKYKIIIWGTGMYFYKNIAAILRYEYELGNIDPVCFTGRDIPKSVYAFEAVQILEKEEALRCEYDFILIASEAETAIQNELMNIYNINTSRIIRGSAFLLPNFNLMEYLKIKMSGVSIFTNNCTAGHIYHWLGLRFASPFINMCIPSDFYLKFLEKPEYYLKQEFTFSHFKDNYNKDDNVIPDRFGYPVFKLGGEIRFDCVHAKTVEEVKLAWGRRIKRVNYGNMLFIMCIINDDDAEKFAALEGINKLGLYIKKTDCNDILDASDVFLRRNKCAEAPGYLIIDALNEFLKINLLHLLAQRV